MVEMSEELRGVVGVVSDCRKQTSLLKTGAVVGAKERRNGQGALRRSVKRKCVEAGKRTEAVEKQRLSTWPRW
jgi:hypothetical protein